MHCSVPFPTGEGPHQQFTLQAGWTVFIIGAIEE
jgi:hypothetical protein